MRKLSEEDITRFEFELRANERTAATLAKYTAALRRLMVWLNGREITHDLLIDYRAYLQETCMPQTVNGALSAINTWLETEGMSDCRVKLLKIQRRVFRSEEKELSRQEFAKLVDTARAQGKMRLMLVMETICATGIRVSELQYITAEAVQAGRVDISLKGKIRVILIPSKLRQKLKKYARKQKITEGTVFLTRNGTPLSRGQIWAEMKALCGAAGVEPTKVFPHNLRHLFARSFYHATRDVVKLADVLGHSSVETTRIYLISTGAEHSKLLDGLGLVS